MEDLEKKLEDWEKRCNELENEKTKDIEKIVRLNGALDKKEEEKQDLSETM